MSLCADLQTSMSIFCRSNSSCCRCNSNRCCCNAAFWRTAAASVPARGPSDHALALSAKEILEATQRARANKQVLVFIPLPIPANSWLLAGGFTLCAARGILTVQPYPKESTETGQNQVVGACNNSSRNIENSAGASVPIRTWLPVWPSIAIRMRSPAAVVMTMVSPRSKVPTRPARLSAVWRAQQAISLQSSFLLLPLTRSDQ